MKRFLCICAAALLYFSCSHTEPVSEKSKMIADIDPFSLGSVSASLDQALSSRLKETTVEVIFYPRQNEVALEFRHETLQFWQFWNETARQNFIESLNQYKEDFANRKLITNYNKSRAIYGKVKGRVEWKVFNFSATYRASPYFELGYRLIEKTPYFITYQNTAKEESGRNKDITESRRFPMYFTRAQGEALAKLFDQDFLLESVGDKALSTSDDYGRDIYIP
jgi:RNA recognition motif-containing protein